MVDNISLEVATGQIFGFLGPNGAGKTTTVKLIGGLLFPDQGSITINGVRAPLPESRRQVGFMSENPQFYQYLKAREVLEFVGGLFQLDSATITKRSLSLLKQVGLSEAAELPVKKFSKGMHQRLGFAAALVNDPELLILDEPLDGLDPLGRLDFKQLLLELKKRRKTIFFSSHILADVAEICDEVAILHQGRIISRGRPTDLVGKTGQTLEEFFVEKVRANV